MEHPLDGAYRITTESATLGENDKRSDGETRIEQSQTERMDHAWCKWTSTFHVISDNVVRMTSVADPSNAAPDFELIRPDGSKTRDPVTYINDLELTRDENGTVKLSGKINAGESVLLLTMEKIGD